MVTRYRPRGVLRRTATALSPSAAAAGRAALERDLGTRTSRLVDAATARIRERRHPTRPTMRALVMAGGGRLAWRAVPTPPPPGPDGALVRPVAVATCDLDRALALGATPFPLPVNMGHECVAEVLTVGDRVTSVRPGQLVAVPFQISCGKCAKCLAGHTSNCLAVPPLSMYGFGVGGGHWGGALAEQLAVPYADGMLLPLPEGVDPVAAASVSDTICDGYRHIGPYLPTLLERDPDAEVLIISALSTRQLFAASVPLYAGQVAVALGARRVRLVDCRQHVRAAAQRLGMVALRPAELRHVPPTPLVVAASATSRGMWLAMEKTAPDGVCSTVGGLYRVGRIPMALLYGRNASFTVSRTNARALMPEVLDLIADGRFHPEHVVTAQGTFDDAPRLLGDHYRGDDIKTILTAA